MSRKIIGAVIALLPAGVARLPAQRRTAWSLTVENDIFAVWRSARKRSDRDYSSGVQLGLARPLSSSARYERTLVLTLDHQIFTPDITEPRAVPADRPYAAVLTAGASLHLDRSDRRHALGIRLSVTGPPALGAELQSLVHELIGSDQPVGWERQLPFEVGLTVVYAGDRRLTEFGGGSGAGLRTAVRWGGELGTIRTAASVGLGATVGWRPPPVWRPLAPAPASRSGVRVFVPLAVGLDVVGQSIVLDGGIIAKAAGIDREALVPHLEFGLGMETGRLAVSWTGHVTGRDFETQPGWHRYGTVRLSLR